MSKDIDIINAIVERVRDTKAMRHIRDDYRTHICDTLFEDEFQQVFLSELQIDINEVESDVVEEIVTKLANTIHSD